MNGASGGQVNFLKLQAKLFLSCYFERAPELTKAETRRNKQLRVKGEPLHVGGRLAWNMRLCGRRYGGESRNYIAVSFPGKKKVR